MLVPWQNLRSSQGSSYPAHSPAPYFSPMGLNSPADPHPDFFSSCLAKCSITKLRLETSFHLWLPPLGLQNHKTCSVLCNIIILPFGLQTWVRGESEDKKIIILEFPYGSPQSNTQLPHHCKNSNSCCKGKNNKYSAFWLACATAKRGRTAGIHGTESENTFYWIPFSTLEPEWPHRDRLFSMASLKLPSFHITVSVFPNVSQL